MAKHTREEIIQRTERLANMMRETEEVDFYKRAEQQINKNTKVNDKIAQIKKLQKQAVNLQHYGKFSALKETEAKIDALQKEIDELPIVNEFKQSQAEVNEMLQMVTKTITNSVVNKLDSSNEEK
ncbi:RicAFT regulatory complex protein RicA family protein [Niallia sp. 03133]|uniref:RicAFT regulatory complex protein RicA family protein n=1 Tax=Niallia sp. 03133 TaxID=3458060 RepID=UPI004044A2EB